MKNDRRWLKQHDPEFIKSLCGTIKVDLRDDSHVRDLERRFAEMKAKRVRRQRVLNRWFLAVTLLRNPSLRDERKHRLVVLREERRREEQAQRDVARASFINRTKATPNMSM